MTIVPVDPGYEKLERLLELLTKDIYVWRMARACDVSGKPNGAYGAHKRRMNALGRIDRLIDSYGEGDDLTVGPPSWMR